MKKTLLATAATVAMATSAMAAVGVEFGSTWFNPRFDPYESFPGPYNWTYVGQSMSVNWDFDGDFAVGAYIENGELNNGQGTAVDMGVNALSFTKAIVKNASLGVRLGTVTEEFAGTDTGILTDLVGSITLLGGSVDKVNGSLKAAFGARFADTEWQGGASYNGYFASISVGLGI